MDVIEFLRKCRRVLTLLVLIVRLAIQIFVQRVFHVAWTLANMFAVVVAMCYLRAALFVFDIMDGTISVMDLYIWPVLARIVFEACA